MKTFLFSVIVLSMIGPKQYTIQELSSSKTAVYQSSDSLNVGDTVLVRLSYNILTEKQPKTITKTKKR